MKIKSAKAKAKALSSARGYRHLVPDEEYSPSVEIDEGEIVAVYTASGYTYYTTKKGDIIRHIRFNYMVQNLRGRETNPDYYEITSRDEDGDYINYNCVGREPTDFWANNQD